MTGLLSLLGKSSTAPAPSCHRGALSTTSPECCPPWASVLQESTSFSLSCLHWVPAEWALAMWSRAGAQSSVWHSSWGWPSQNSLFPAAGAVGLVHSCVLWGLPPPQALRLLLLPKLFFSSVFQTPLSLTLSFLPSAWSFPWVVLSLVLTWFINSCWWM